MPPEVWALSGVIVSVLGSLGVAKLAKRAQDRKTEADAEVGAGQLALDTAREARTAAKEAKNEAVTAKTEATAAHRQAEMAQRALHQTRIWWMTEHVPWDDAVVAVLKRVDPAAADELPQRREPPLWPKE